MNNAKRYQVKIEVFRMDCICKTFMNNVVLNNVSLSLNKGEVLALVSKNGGGKSTLAGIAGGVCPKDAGRIYWRENQVQLNSPFAAQKLGIHIVHQEPEIVPELDIAQNIFLGNEIYYKSGPFLNHRQMHEEAKKLLLELELDLDPYMHMSSLSFAQWQLIMVAKAMATHPSFLILDEATSSLSKSKFEIIKKIIFKLKAEGVPVLFISHKLDEVFQVADRISVLCDGLMVGTFRADECTRDKLISLMAGQSQKMHVWEREENPKGTGQEVLRVESLYDGQLLRDISFSLKRGEVLGIAGIVGAGRTELLSVLFGLRKKRAGTIWVNGKQVEIRSPLTAIRHKIGMMPEERIRQGLFMNLTMEENMTISSVGRFSRLGFLIFRLRRALTEFFIERLEIKPRKRTGAVTRMSGGNQQKMLFAKYLSYKPDILLLDEPTKGIDVIAKVEILSLIKEMSCEGKGIIVVSSEIPDLFEVCDRILVMKEGMITAELTKEDFSEEEVLSRAIN